MTTTATRAQLTQYFAKRCIPTQSNFTDLINGMLNQADDGIVKSAGNPLSIAAAGDATTSQRVLNLYASLSDNNPAWTLQLKPRSDPSDPTTAHSGFSISDATGTSRLFIDAGTYNVGIGTNTPQALLDINGGANVGTSLNVGAGLTVSGSQVFIGQDSTPNATSNINTNRVICFFQEPGDNQEQNAGKIIYSPLWCPHALTIAGWGGTVGSRAIALYDNVTIENTLTISNNYSSASPGPALTVNGAALFNNTLTVFGSSNLADLTVSGAATLSSGLAVTGDISATGKLTSKLWGITLSKVAGNNTLSGTFTSHGGHLLIFVSGSGRNNEHSLETTFIGMSVTLDNLPIGEFGLFTFITDHVSFLPGIFAQSAASGSHTILLTPNSSTMIDNNDHFTVLVMEFPY